MVFSLEVVTLQSACLTGIVLKASLIWGSGGSARDLSDLVAEEPHGIGAGEGVGDDDILVVGGSSGVEVHVLAIVDTAEGGREESIALPEENEMNGI